MNLNDFRCMRRGLHVSLLTQQEAGLIEPIHISNGQQKNALLLLHGFSSTPAVYRNFIAEFAQYDAIIAPVLPGHGENIEAFAAMKANDLLAFVEEIGVKLTQEFEHVDVMGLSLGGVLAGHLASRLKLRHLYLLAPAFDLHLAIDKAIKLAQVLHTLGFRKLRSVAGNIYIPNACEIAYRQLPLTSVIELLNLIKQFEFKLPTCPTDLFLGSHDEVVASQYVAERFANSENTTIHWLENSAHVLPLDGDLEEIIACVKKHFPEIS